MTAADWGYVIVLVACIFLAALASGTETALTSVNRLRVRHLAEEGSAKAELLQRLHSDPNRFLSTVLVVNTLTLILASAATTLLTLDLLDHRLVQPWRSLADFGISLGLTIFLLIFAEVTPKTLAVRNADRIALQVSPAVDRLATVLRPVLWFVTGVTRIILPGVAGRGRVFVTEAELMTLLNVSEEQGVIEEQERDMIQGIVEIGDKVVREVMVPRVDMIAIERGGSAQQVADLIEQHGHTRIPVYERDLDHLVGVVHAKDVLRLLARDQRQAPLQRILRPLLTTPEQKKVDELLHEMRKRQAHMMVVIDEYGGTAGIVTLEDVLEEIVGEIRDEYDLAETDKLQLLNDHEALVNAAFPIDELNEILALGINESEDYDSVAGYVISALGAIPAAGATFAANGVQWTVDAVNGRRILAVRLRSEHSWPREALIDHGLAEPETEPGPQATARE